MTTPTTHRTNPISIWVITLLTLLGGAWFCWTLTDDVARENVAGLMLWSGSPDNVYVAQPLSAHYAIDDLDGSFRFFQLFSYALIDRNAFDLAVSVLLLLLLGTRLNEILGNILFPITYVLLMVLAALSEHLALHSAPPMALAGPGGAVMGLAGLVLVLCPLSRIGITIGPSSDTNSLKIFQARGLSLVVFTITFYELLPLALRTTQHIPHGAQIGGFIAGILLGAILLMTGLAQTQGADIAALWSAPLPTPPRAAKSAH
jgi:membrane associated rhomboid family serine protease